MFSRTLWHYYYKQTKWMVWLLWLTTLFFLPYQYYYRALSLEWAMKSREDVYYQFYWMPGEISLIQMGCLIGLACMLIGWARNTQSMDVLWALPFSRRQLFLSKWAFGIGQVIALHAITYGLMFLVKKTTLHDQHQDFTVFSIYFGISLISLSAVFSFALFVGTFAGNAVSQAALSVILLVLPYGLFTLVDYVCVIHTPNQVHGWNVEPLKRTVSSLSPAIPVTGTEISYNEYPENQEGVRQDDNAEYQFSYGALEVPYPLLTTLLVPYLYLAASIWMGLKLYERSPNEANGKMLLFPSLGKLCLISAAVCFGLLGGQMITGRMSASSPPVFYAGAFITGCIAYWVLQRLMRLRLSWPNK